MKLNQQLLKSFETPLEISNISHHESGILGHQRLTIKGNYFDYSDFKIQVTISGTIKFI